MSADEGTKRAGPSGPNLMPLKKYLEAQQLHDQGKDDESLQLLSEALGSKEPLIRLKDSLGRVFDRTSELSDVTLHLTLVETRRRI